MHFRPLSYALILNICSKLLESGWESSFVWSRVVWEQMRFDASSTVVRSLIGAWVLHGTSPPFGLALRRNPEIRSVVLCVHWDPVDTYIFIFHARIEQSVQGRSMLWKTGGGGGGHKVISQHGQGWMQAFSRLVSTRAEGAIHLGGSGGMLRRQIIYNTSLIPK